MKMWIWYFLHGKNESLSLSCFSYFFFPFLSKALFLKMNNHNFSRKMKWFYHFICPKWIADPAWRHRSMKRCFIRSPGMVCWKYQRDIQTTRKAHFFYARTYEYTITAWTFKWISGLAVKLILLFVSRHMGSSHTDTDFPWPPPTAHHRQPLSLFLCLLTPTQCRKDRAIEGIAYLFSLCFLTLFLA